MYGSSAYRPLHLPAPRHRDRRAGEATDALRAALLEPSGPRPVRPRTVEARRASRRRLAARHRGRARTAGLEEARAAAVAVVLAALSVYALATVL